MTFNHDAIDDLAQHCEEETSKFYRFLPHDQKPCFELLRLGLMLINHYAFEHIYNIYQPQVLRWMQRHNSYEIFRDERQALINASFARLYEYLHGDRFLQKVDSVPAVMLFFKKCVWSIIREYLRKMPPIVPYDDSQIMPQEMDSDFFQEEIWQRINELLPEKRQRLLVHCAFVLDMKPAQIFEQYSHLWPNSHAVSSQLHRIRTILRNDNDLRDLFS